MIGNEETMIGGIAQHNSVSPASTNNVTLFWMYHKVAPVYIYPFTSPPSGNFQSMHKVSIDAGIFHLLYKIFQVLEYTSIPIHITTQSVGISSPMHKVSWDIGIFHLLSKT